MKWFFAFVLALSISFLPGTSSASPLPAHEASTAHILQVKTRAHHARRHKAHHATRHHAHPAKT